MAGRQVMNIAKSGIQKLAVIESAVGANKVAAESYGYGPSGYSGQYGYGSPSGYSSPAGYSSPSGYSGNTTGYNRNYQGQQSNYQSNPSTGYYSGYGQTQQYGSNYSSY